VKYETPELRETARLASLERAKLNAKKKREERKKNEKIQTVHEWFLESQRDLKTNK